MKALRAPRKDRRIASLVLLACVAAPGLAWSAPSAAELYYERALMQTAGQRCGLFTPDISAALDAAKIQARGAALRAGIASAALDAAQGRARLKAYSVACASPDLALAARRVRTAFQNYALVRRMNFPGTVADWRAERPLATQSGARWTLVQYVRMPAGALLFGLADTDGLSVLTAVSTAPEAARAAGARLVVRNPAMAPDPYLDSRRGLAGRAAPRALSSVFLAQSKRTAAKTLLPSEAKSGVAFQFPPAAADALARLDPREAVTVELVYPSVTGERVQAGFVEVGDFAAGRAFLAAWPKFRGR